MGFKDLMVSSLTSPKSYNDVRPHHVLALYATYYFGFSRLFNPICNKLAKFLLQWTAHISDYAIPLIQRGFVPDFLIRYGIRLRLRSHLQELESEDVETELQIKQNIVKGLTNSPIAIETDAANQQHYEVPAAFYDMCLGPCKKYSSGYWPASATKTKTTFEESELQMLQVYCERAQVHNNGMKIVDLGCGWGSLTLYLLEHFPNTHVTSISNSHSQREYIMKTAEQRNLNMNNLKIITCNVSDDKDHQLDQVQDQDLVMTIEMFEHMKNYQDLLEKVHKFLKKDVGKLFVHIFTHKDYCYHFDGGWMSDNFFTGGTMPSDDLLLYFGKDFYVLNHWRVNGSHYEKTSNGWLQNLDVNWKNGRLKPVLADAYGVGNEREWYINWRLFFLACAELWGLDNGKEWIVSHYLFQCR